MLVLREAPDEVPGGSNMVESEGRLDDEDDSLRRICLNPPSSIDVARDSDTEPPWEREE